MNVRREFFEQQRRKQLLRGMLQVLVFSGAVLLSCYWILRGAW